MQATFHLCDSQGVLSEQSLEELIDGLVGNTCWQQIQCARKTRSLHKHTKRVFAHMPHALFHMAPVRETGQSFSWVFVPASACM